MPSHLRSLSFLTVALVITSVASFTTTYAAATARKVLYGGKTYYVVDGSNAAIDTGAEACASVGLTCQGYTNLGSNAVCKAAHPTAKQLMSVNGSKNGFYCNGAPQTGLACAKNLNTCEVCPTCNLNATCNTQIGTQFREMYVQCGGPLKSSSSSARSSAKSSLRPVSSSARSSAKSSVRSAVSSMRSSSTGRAGLYGPLPLPTGPALDARIGQYPGKKVCEFYQATKPGDPVRATKKLVTCSAYKAGDTFCVNAMQSRFAKAEKCEDNGIIICSIPCTAQGASNLKMCASDINRPRGNNAAPIDFCGGMSLSSAASSVPAKKAAGQQCVHGGDCQSGMCLGVVPGQYYVCSCIDPTTRWQSCNK